jgi:ABC-type multidrug transport system ATPase subunit
VSLVIRHCAIRRGRRTVLEGGTIAATAPAAIAVVGINGSGKSSLFMHLTGALESRGMGTITVNDAPATIAYVPQVPALPGWLTVAQIGALQGTPFDHLVETMPGLYLDELAGMRADRLSVGQRQALAIALALGRRAAVTLLDEPFSALDFRRRIGVIGLLHGNRAAGRSIMLSSQSAADLAAVCERFVVIRDGRYVFNGLRDQLAPAGSDTALENALLDLFTLPVPAMEAPGERR